MKSSLTDLFLGITDRQGDGGGRRERHHQPVEAMRGRAGPVNRRLRQTANLHKVAVPER